MASLQEDYSDPGSFTDEDSQLFPRCSTPIIDPRAVCRPQENRGTKIVEKSKKYCDWKNRLHRKKHSRKFKLRSTENIPQFWSPANSTIVSGYVKQELPEEINEESIARPQPVYQQVWVPISAPFLGPAMSNCHLHPNPAMWFKIPLHQTPQQYQFAPVFGASGETAFFDMINNGHCHNHLPCGLHHYHHHHHHHHDHNYCAVGSQIIPCEHHYPQAHMTHEHYHYPYYHYPTQTQYYTYPSETQRTSSNENGGYHEENVFSDMISP